MKVVHFKIDPALLADLDALVAATPDANRSQMIRGAIRLTLAQQRGGWLASLIQLERLCRDLMLAGARPIEVQRDICRRIADELELIDKARAAKEEA